MLEKYLTAKFKTTDEYEKLEETASCLQKDFMKRIAENDELQQKYLELEQALNNSSIEFENIVFREGARIGFKLCMDIFDL